MLEELRSLRDEGGFLAHLSDVEVEDLCRDLEEARCAAGEVLMRAGEEGDQVCIVLQGRLGAVVVSEGEARIAHEIGPGEIAGEIALLVGGSRVADLRALEDSRLAVLRKQGFDQLMERSPAAAHHITEIGSSRLQRLHLSAHLNRLFGPFGEHDAEVLRQLEEEVEFITLKSGENLFRQGDPAESAFIVMSGSLRVAVDTPEGEQVINEVPRGETVGEMALLTDDPRSATVFAVRDSNLARISRQGFNHLIDCRPQLMMNVSRILIDRLKRRSVVGVQRQAPCLTIGLVPANTSVQLAEVARDLADGLAAYGPVALLSSAEVDSTLGRPGIAQASESDPSCIRLSQWLHEREENLRYALYVADSTWTPWTERCARQADHVVTIADSEGAPDLGEIESRLEVCWHSGRAPRRSLVLRHPSDLDRPRDTSRWFSERSVDSVYHLRTDHARDLRRLVRILAGRAVGLVLGGGGARGFAQVGVLRALEELKIEVDIFGGTSIGACMAAYGARGLSSAEIQEQLEKHWRSLLDYTFPIASLIEGRRINNLIEEFVLTWDLEDLWFPFYCVSTNLTTARAVIHRRGALARALRASVAIPGVLPPVPENGELLIDGGVLNNLPVDVMRELNPFGPVIAIDVFSPKGPVARSDYGMSLSGWRLAVNKINPFRKTIRVPSLAETMIRSTLVGASLARAEVLRKELADFYRNIHVRGVGMLQFDVVAKSIQIGYEDTIEPLREWVDSGGLEGR